MADFNKSTVGDVQTILVVALVTDTTYISGSVTLAHDQVELLLQIGAHFLGEFLTGNKCDFKVQIFSQVQPGFFSLLSQMHKIAGSTDITGNTQLLHDFKLAVGRTGTSGNNCAVKIAQGSSNISPAGAR